MKKEYTGLSESEILYNQQLYGKNEITHKKERLNIKLLFQPTVLLLIIIMIIYFILNKVNYGIVIFIISIIILLIYIFKQIKISKLVKDIKVISSDKCRVIRNGKISIINSTEITIDDILILNKGDKVCADAIILESNNMYADESILDEKNKNVYKCFDLLDKNAMLKSNYVYRETFIKNGSGVAKVINIGDKTEYSKKNINKKFLEDDGILQIQINKIHKIFIIISILLFILIGTISIIKDNNILIGLLKSSIIALSILPLTTTINFNLLVTKLINKLTKNNAVIKQTSTIDKLNDTSCICVDKLGIITDNNMVVKEFYPSIEYEEALLNCALSCDKNSNDLYEKAILEYLRINNVNIDSNYKLIKTYPFTKETKIMANVYEYNNELYLFVKGTLNGLFDICNLDVEDKYKLHNFQKQLFKKGMEVIAFASKKIDKIEDDIFKYYVDFNGIVSLYSPIKSNIKENIEICKNLNIKPVIFCEDKKEIATFISNEIGIGPTFETIAGKEIEKLTDNELASNISKIGVFSRVTQKQKEKIFKTLKKTYKQVALDNNSLDDIELLKEADISISMNKIGTDISKNISDLIILDDNFTTIVNTITSSKEIVSKIKKLIKYIIMINIISSILSLGLILFNIYILILPIYILILKIILENVCFMILRK